MIRTNLATRPFYNERAVHAVLAFAALIVLALTAFNVWRITTLTREQRDLSARAADAESKATALRAEAARIRQTLNPLELKAVSASASEANTIIDRRLFSWTELFNRLESTLPEDARIVSVRPQIDKAGDVSLSMTVIGKRDEDIDLFLNNLEGTGVFAGMLSREDTTNQDGTIQSHVEGRYAPSRPVPAPKP